MKKFLAMMLALVMALSLVACGEQGDSQKGDDSASGDKVVKIGVFEPTSGQNGGGGKKEILGIEYARSLKPTVTINGEAKSLKAFAGSKVAGVNPNSKNPKVAMQFAAFLASTDGQLLRYQVRSAIPVATALAEDPAIASDIVATAILDTIANTSLLQPSLPEMANWWVPIETLGRNIVAGKVTAENGADSLAQTLDLINNPAL